MAQGLFGGATSYEEQSLSDIKLDVLKWIGYTKQIQDEMNTRLQKAKESGFWSKVGYDFQMTIYSSMRFYETIIEDLNRVKTSIEHNTILDRDVILLRKIGKNSINYNINDYPKSYKGGDNERWHDYGNPEFRNVEDMYADGRDFFVTLQDAVNAASRLEDYVNNQNVINNTMNIGGNVENSQIQQGTIKSIQAQTTQTEFDYDKIYELLVKIHEYSLNDLFQQEFGTNTDEVRKNIEEAIAYSQNREHSSKIKELVQKIKDVAAGISGGIIANGIYQLIQSVFS